MVSDDTLNMVTSKYHKMMKKLPFYCARISVNFGDFKNVKKNTPIHISGMY